MLWYLPPDPTSTIVQGITCHPAQSRLDRYDELHLHHKPRRQSRESWLEWRILQKRPDRQFLIQRRPLKEMQPMCIDVLKMTSLKLFEWKRCSNYQICQRLGRKRWLVRVWSILRCDRLLMRAIWKRRCKLSHRLWNIFPFVHQIVYTEWLCLEQEWYWYSRSEWAIPNLRQVDDLR